MINPETYSALKELREELNEEAKDQDRRKNFLGKKLDQVELCYKQYSPPQCLNLNGLT